MCREKLLSNFLDREAIWLSAAREGKFAVLPDPFCWDDSYDFAHIINGYEASEYTGRGELAIWANERRSDANCVGTWVGTALELWLCLFYEHRRFRHLGFDPIGGDLLILNSLCQNLRQSLQNIDSSEIDLIMRLVKAK